MVTRDRLILTVTVLLMLGITVIPAGSFAGTNSASYTWSKVQLVSGSSVPLPRISPGMVYDPHDGYMLMYGGWNKDNQYLSDTWNYVSNTWTQLSPSVSPGPRDSPALAYDPADGYVILFGGENSNGQLNDTWSFQNGVWTLLHPARAPLSRVDASMVYDGGQGLILFGGVDKSQADYHYYNDTWSFQHGSWQLVTTTTAPSARGAQAMVYDPATNGVFLFGGSTDYYSVKGGQSDTWMYSSGMWQQLHPQGSPDHRDSLGLVWDPRISGIVFYGGWDPAGVCGNDQNDTRVYRDGYWRQLPLTVSPGERAAFGMDYDQIDNAIILFGGQMNPGASPEAGCGTLTVMNDTWQFGITPVQSKSNTNGTVNASTVPSTMTIAIYGAGSGLVVAVAALGVSYGWRRLSSDKPTDPVSSIPGQTLVGTTTTTCPACRAALPGSSSFCGECGSRLDVD